MKAPEREARIKALIALSGGEADDEAGTYYSPSTGKVACVLLSSLYGCDRRVSRIFDSRDWFVAPMDDMVPVKGTLREWAEMALDAPQDRPGPEAFAHSGGLTGQATSAKG